MAEKTTKKTTAKKTVSKTVRAKNTTTKKITPAQTIEKHECGCAHGCTCHGHCGEKKCTFGRFVKKFIVFLIIFAMGFATAKLCCMNRQPKMPRPEFENGCLVVQCPKMAAKIQMMDKNNDGCVSREEFRAARKMFRKNKPGAPKPMHPEMPQPAPMVAE